VTDGQTGRQQIGGQNPSGYYGALHCEQSGALRAMRTDAMRTTADTTVGVKDMRFGSVIYK